MNNRVSGVRMLDVGLGLGLQSVLLFPIFMGLVVLYALDNYYWRYATGAKSKTYSEWLGEIQ